MKHSQFYILISALYVSEVINDIDGLIVGAAFLILACFATYYEKSSHHPLTSQARAMRAFFFENHYKPYQKFHEAFRK